MAFPTGNGLGEAWTAVLAKMRQIKSFCTTANGIMAAGSVDSSRLLNLYAYLGAAKSELASLASTPGLAQYAKDQMDDQDLDIVAEFTSVTDAIDDVTTWFADNFPKDGNGYLLARQFSSGAVVDRSFTSQQTAGLRTKLTALIATIG